MNTLRNHLCLSSNFVNFGGDFHFSCLYVLSTSTVNDFDRLKISSYLWTVETYSASCRFSSWKSLAYPVTSSGPLKGVCVPVPIAVKMTLTTGLIVLEGKTLYWCQRIKMLLWQKNRYNYGRVFQPTAELVALSPACSFSHIVLSMKELGCYSLHKGARHRAILY